MYNYNSHHLNLLMSFCIVRPTSPDSVSKLIVRRHWTPFAAVCIIIWTPSAERTTPVHRQLTAPSARLTTAVWVEAPVVLPSWLWSPLSDNIHKDESSSSLEKQVRVDISEGWILSPKMSWSLTDSWWVINVFVGHLTSCFHSQMNAPC